METIKTYEHYPVGTVIQSALVSLSIYGLGFLVIFRLGAVFAFLYLLYILVLEYRLLRYECTNCYYWGKTCAFGQGRLSAWLFRKGKPANFCRQPMTWKALIPDMLVSVIPFSTGIVLIILKFDFVLLAALLLLALLTTSGNGYIRGTLACKHCRQRELGCPAEELFRKKN